MTRTLDAEWYTSEIVHEHERHSVWRQHWVMVAVVAELSEPGSYVATDVAGWPLLIVRRPDGELVGHLNVCPHRAGPILWPGSGRTGNLVCRYHGWAFDWDGRLRSARDFGTDVCAEESSLTPIRVETWGPLVFACLDPDAPSFASTLGDLDDRVHEFGFHTMPYVRRLVRDLSCNWKTYVDNYLEAYHVPLLHPLLNSAIDVKTYEVTVPDPNYCLHRADAHDGAASAGLWFFKYPNLGVNVYPGAMNVERIVPVSLDRTMVVYDYFSFDRSEERLAAMLEMSNVTLDEDQAIAEAVQKNLASGAYRPGQLSPKHENGLAWFHQRLRLDVPERPN